MQVSTTRHLSGVSIGRTAEFGYSFSGSDATADATCTRVSGGSGSTIGTSATETAGSTPAGSGGSRGNVATAATEFIATDSNAVTDVGAALTDAAAAVAGFFLINVTVFSIPDEPTPPTTAAPQPARATVPLNAAKTANRAGSITSPSPIEARPRLAPRSSPAKYHPSCQ